MTLYKWQTFKALPLPSSVPYLLLNIAFRFFLITRFYVLNTFHTFFFIVMLLTRFFFIKIRVRLLLPLHLFLPLLFHLISLFSFYTLSSSTFNTFFYLPFGLFFNTFPPFAVSLPLPLSLHIFSLCPLPLPFFPFHASSLSFFLSFPLMQSLVFRIWNG